MSLPEDGDGGGSEAISGRATEGGWATVGNHEFRLRGSP